ncbi:major facilitator superfamily domain-containing protein 8-like isoform X5 [Malaya genurostris]|uniref:major facilitator superfamily domain-containing protein 8-like isoform X5 n=1 Tax=Malaya genurostris TaxID=325434 RepID=UPI0026F3DC7F|nr:major facilitator superfamily domain-containing protein 8-like isoform X5 [Malaya genurostris]
MNNIKNWISLEQPEKDRLLGFETEDEYRRRWISIRVMYYTAYLVYFAFGIVSTCLWPYFRSVDTDADKYFLTYLMSIPSVLQLVLSPVLGWWSNKATSVRIVFIPLLVSFILGQLVYVAASEVPHKPRYVLLFSRVFVGISMVSCAIYRSYISAATTVMERTPTVCHLALAQGIGLVNATVFQSLISFLGQEGFRVLGLFRVNMHTAVGWFFVLLGIINIILFLPFIFEDHNIAVKEAAKGQNSAVLLADKIPGQSMLGIILICVAFGLMMFIYSGLQTLLSPIALDQFGWTNEESLFYLGILMTAGALISCILFLVLDPLCKRFSEIGVLVYGAMLALFLSQLLMIPVGTKPITAYIDVNSTTGCPPTQEWCQSIPPVTKIQFTISYTLLCIAFSIGTTLSQAVFSKLLGPRPQGTWMALLTCAGSAARIVGPGSVTAYVIVGTYWTFGASTVLSGIIFLWMWVYRNRLQPSKPDSVEELKVLSSTKQ